MPARGRAWGLSIATIAFGVVAFGLLGLVALAVAALLVAAGPTRPREWAVAILAGAVGFGLVISTAVDVLDAAVGAYSLIVAAAFAGGALLAPAGVWRQAVRATLWGVAATAGLGLTLRGPRFWAEMQWSVTHETSSAVRTVVSRWPDSYSLYQPMVHFFGTAFPGLLVLQTLAALALAWQWHQRVAATPLGAPALPFRQFRFGDQWVWGLVAALLVWAVPKFAVLKSLALNLGLVLSVLYCLRGAAIVVALAGGAGIPLWTLTIGMVIAFALVVPLLVLIPSLWTLGVFDTWLAFRQRRTGQPSVR